MLALDFLVGAAIVVISQMPASAAARLHCLSRNEQRAAIASGHAVPLAAARRSARHRAAGELVRARLCREGGHLVYLLTVLPRDGKVRRVTVNAENGKVVSDH
jgi:uncharacterized membrane protein YkoI